MDDQRPMSGGEKVFFSSGTGSGIFIIYVFLKVSNTLFFKCLLWLFSPSLIHWWRSVIKSCDYKERIIRRLKLQCMSLQIKSFRMSIFPVCWPPTFHQKHISAWQVIYYFLIFLYINSHKFQKWTRMKINVLNCLKKLQIFLTMMFWSICLFQHSRTILICVSKRVLSEYFVLVTF